MKIIGRKAEKKQLSDYLESKYPEFIAVYGRRRVGKTFLIKEYFGNHFAFYMTGMANTDMVGQLENFNESLRVYGDDSDASARHWFDAFLLLKKLLSDLPGNGKKVVFIDELPWLNTPKSKFLSALEHFWNSWASSRPDILLIVCGSATSWMLDNLINNKGGLHNRLTGQIALSPFTLGECEEYYRDRGLAMDRYRIAESYMIFGGIPYYMSLMKRRFSLPQNVDALCFSENGSLKDEFERLYASLFKHSENHIRVVETLAGKKRGLTRKEIENESGLSNGGGLTKILSELEQCAFIRKYRDFTLPRKGQYYQLADSFTLFYLNFMREQAGRDEHFWSVNYNNATCNTWRGYAFERVCMAHVRQIKSALGISGVSTALSSWRSKQSDPGAQIDLILDRADGVINLCEIKYANKQFLLNKTYDLELREKVESFREETKTTKALHLTMLTTFGLKRNIYSENIQSEIALDDLFGH